MKNENLEITLLTLATGTSVLNGDIRSKWGTHGPQQTASGGTGGVCPLPAGFVNYSDDTIHVYGLRVASLTNFPDL